jgi:hypothetical protein
MPIISATASAMAVIVDTVRILSFGAVGDGTLMLVELVI